MARYVTCVVCSVCIPLRPSGPQARRPSPAPPCRRRELRRIRSRSCSTRSAASQSSRNPSPLDDLRDRHQRPQVEVPLVARAGQQEGRLDVRLLGVEDDAPPAANADEIEPLRAGHEDVRHGQARLENRAALGLAFGESLGQFRRVEPEALAQQHRRPLEERPRRRRAGQVENRAVGDEPVEPVQPDVVPLDRQVFQLGFEFRLVEADGGDPPDEQDQGAGPRDPSADVQDVPRGRHDDERRKRQQGRQPSTRASSTSSSVYTTTPANCTHGNIGLRNRGR